MRRLALRKVVSAIIPRKTTVITNLFRNAKLIVNLSRVKTNQASKLVCQFAALLVLLGNELLQRVCDLQILDELVVHRWWREFQAKLCHHVTRSLNLRLLYTKHMLNSFEIAEDKRKRLDCRVNFGWGDFTILRLTSPLCGLDWNFDNLEQPFN
jgi:hypothetical protein